jgi:hypothetical protein
LIAELNVQAHSAQYNQEQAARCHELLELEKERRVLAERAAREELGIATRVADLAAKDLQRTSNKKSRSLAAARVRRGIVAEKNRVLTAELGEVDARLARLPSEDEMVRTNMALRRRLEQLEHAIATSPQATRHTTAALGEGQALGIYGDAEGPKEGRRREEEGDNGGFARSRPTLAMDDSVLGAPNDGNGGGDSVGRRRGAGVGARAGATPVYAVDDDLDPDTNADGECVGKNVQIDIFNILPT